MLGGVDAFAGAFQGGRAHQRKVQQDRFEYRVACDILRAFEPQAGAAKAVINKLGDVTVFDVQKMGFPIHLVTVKLRKTLMLHDILKHLMKSGLKTHVEEAIDTFQLEPWAIIFASDGDALQDLVIHSDANLVMHMESWYAVLPEQSLFLTTLKGFLASARKWYDEWYIEL
jgi:hypothetical protein